MQKINVGFPINLEKLIETRLLVQANSGGGKSYLLRKLMEESNGKVQNIIIDYEGEFVTLREKHDVIIFGKGHDIPINIQHADKLARYLLELNADAIMDLSELHKHERILFVRRFLESMISSPKNLWHPVLVFLDESHIFCPEDSKAESMQAVIDLCTLGRKRGYCAILATQRIAKLNKDAAAELNNKMIGRTSLDVDVKRTASELGINYNDAKQMLRQLQEGEFYVFGPAISQEVTKQKVSQVKTTHAKSGMKFSKITPPSKAIQKLISKIEGIPAEVEQEQNDIKALQEKIKQLQTQLKTNKPVQQVDPAIVANLKKELSMHQALLKQYEAKLKAIGPQIKKIKSSSDAGYETLFKLIEDGKITSPNQVQLTATIKVKNPNKEPVTTIFTDQKIGHGKTPVFETVMQQLKDNPHKRKIMIPTTESDMQDIKLGKCERAILTVLAQEEKPANKMKIAIRSGYSGSSGGFNNSLAKLRTSGFIEGHGDMKITDAGLEALGTYDTLPLPGEELQQYWFRELGKCESAILQALVLNHPNTHSKEQLAQITGYSASSGGFNNSLSKLRTLELIEGRGEIKASDSLFN